MKKMKVLLAATLLGFGSQPAQAIILNIDYSYDSNNFFADQVRRDIFEAAAGFYETRISDSLLAINSTPLNRFDAVFSRPDTGASLKLSGFNVAADTLTIFAGGMNLGGSTLGTGGAGGYNISYSSHFFADNAITRGQGDGTRSSIEGASAFDYASWGGTISFDSASSWYFDNDVDTDEAFSGFDFFSVALHEIGHVLGFGIVDSWKNQIIAGTFTGANSTAVFGGAVPLSGNAHWADGISSGGRETAFDPNIANGQRKRLTDLDLAALRDIGWEMHPLPVPVPGAVWLFASALLGLLGLSRRRVA